MDVWWLAAGISAFFATIIAVALTRPQWLLAAPRVVLLVFAAITIGALAVLIRTEPLELRLSIDPSTEPLIPENDPGQALYDSAVRDFGDDEVYVIALECDEVFTVECLGIIESISGPISRLDGVRSISSLLDVTSFRYVAEEDWIEVRPFIDEIPSDPAELAELRARALRDPVYRQTLISDDARVTAINVSFRKMTNSELIERDLDGKIREILERETGLAHRFYLSGRPHFKTHVYQGILRDLRWLIPLGVVAMGFVLWVFTGSVRGVVLPLTGSLAAIVWTFAAMVLSDRTLNLLTVMLAPMLLAIGCVYVVHFLSRYTEDATETETLEEAALKCMRHIAVPVVIAGVTTVIGFAALLITDVPAVFELGLLSMLGIGSLTAITLTAVPAALLILPMPALARPNPSTFRARMGYLISQALDRLLITVAGLVHRGSAWIMVACCSAALVALVYLPSIVIDTDYLSYFDESDRVRVDFDAINESLAGAVPLYLVFEGGEEGSFREPALLRAMERLQARIDALPGVSRTLSFIDSLRMLNRAFEGDVAQQERVPDTRGGVTELLFMLPKSEMSRYVTVNHARSNIVIRTGEVGSAAVSELAREIEAVVADTPLPDGITAKLTGNALLLSRSADGIARSQPKSVAVAAIAIFLMIAVGLRSPRLGAVAMIPNLLPVLVFYGLLGIGAAPLSLPTSLIGCIALGIAIDDTVHFLVRYRSERLIGLDSVTAAMRCGRHIGRPIAITSVMLVVGFLVVATSEFATVREFGILTAVTMAVCLIADLILLPALLTRLRI